MKTICEYCKSIINRKTSKSNLLVNACQIPSKRVFCSKKCKNKWIRAVQKNKEKEIVEWAIGVFFERCFFVQKILKAKAINNLCSYFSRNLGRLEKLELIEKKGMNILRDSRTRIWNCRAEPNFCQESLFLKKLLKNGF